METLHAERLMALARFLYNVLPPEKFNFGNVLKGMDVPNETFSCGTVGCAIGWAPVVFPLELRYVKPSASSTPHVTDARGLVFDVHWCGATPAVTDFFGISEDEAIALFAPGAQRDLDLPGLHSGSSAPKVAQNIAMFVSKRFPNIDTLL
jgi:hypothetical protein